MINIISQSFAPHLPTAYPAIGLRKLLLLVSIALSYGFAVSQLPDVHFKDFNNYLVYAESAWVILLRYVNQGLIPLLSNEPVWLLINDGLSLFLGPVTVVRTIIFLGASSVAWLILRHHPRNIILLILFLLLPQLVKNYLTHIRQGAAIAVFLWGWFAVNRPLRWLLMGLTPFIHSSFFFVLFLAALSKFIGTIRFSQTLKTATLLAVSITVGLGLGFLAELFGARQAGQYNFELVGVSGLGFALWFIVLGLMISAEKIWLRAHTFELSIVIFYLITYWLFEVTARIFESGLIIVLLAGLTLRGWRRQAFLGLVLGGGALAWVLRIGQPALGFA